MIPTDPADSTFWTMLEAIGTVLASAIALFGLLYFEVFRPWMRKPSLSLKYEARSPYSSLTDLVLGGKPPRIVTSLARTIRVAVFNTSKTAAVGVRVKLTALGRHDLMRDDSFVSYDLPWADISETRRPILAYGEQAFVDLLIGVRSDPQAWWFQPYDPTHSRGFGNVSGLPETPEPPFKAYLELVAYAENMDDPVTQVFEVAYDKPEKLGALELSAADVSLKQPEYLSRDEVRRLMASTRT